MASDPIFAAIYARRQAFVEYMNAVEADVPDNVSGALCEQECRASIKALGTTPTTLAGLLAFCEFGAELSREAKRHSSCGLGDWMPYAPIGGPDGVTAEEMFFATLERAARLLHPVED